MNDEEKRAAVIIRQADLCDHDTIKALADIIWG
jgi:hypothetical protein